MVIDGLTRTEIVRYAGAAGEFTPVHFDDAVAREVGYPGVFAQGMLVMGETGRVITDWFDISTVETFGVRFITQVWPEDVLTVHATVTEVKDENGFTRLELSIRTTNQRDDDVMVGSATLRLGRSDRAPG